MFTDMTVGEVKMVPIIVEDGVQGSLEELAQAPIATPRALRQAERAITSTLEHHAHVQLRAAA